MTKEKNTKGITAVIGTAAAFAIVLSLAFAGCQGKKGSENVIEAGGSTSVAPLMELLADGFREAHPEIRININGTGSSDGIQNTGSLYQIGMTSRELTMAEIGMGLTQMPIAVDGIAVIAHGTNPVGNLSIEQLRGIYTGEITDWSEVSSEKSGTIAVVTREEGSGTRASFEEIIGFPGKLRLGAVETSSTGAVRASVAGNPDAIGYVSANSVDPSVRAVSVEGIEPSEENIRNGSYRIARQLILLYADLQPAGRTFLDWIKSDGQAIIASGWVVAE
jgi:phosphate transport system substrate-binding protein